MKPGKRRSTLYGLTGIAIIFLIWEISLRGYLAATGEFQFAGFLPERGVAALINLLGQSRFWSSVGASFSRIFLGLSISTVLGIAGGILIGTNRILLELSSPPIQFLRMVSPISWMPIALIFLPGFEEAIIFIVAVATVWPILLNSANGIAGVDPKLLEMAQNQGARRWSLLFRLILPAALPQIMSGLRFAIGIAWVVLVPAELLGISSGLGYLINDARNTLEYDILIAVILAIGILGFALDQLFHQIQRRLDWYQ